MRAFFLPAEWRVTKTSLPTNFCRQKRKFFDTVVFEYCKSEKVKTKGRNFRKRLEKVEKEKPQIFSFSDKKRYVQCRLSDDKLLKMCTLSTWQLFKRENYALHPHLLILVPKFNPPFRRGKNILEGNATWRGL